MNKIVCFFFLFVLNYTYGQENTPAAKLAHHLADKMADSLRLTNQQRAKIFKVNMDLYKEKAEARGKSKDRIIVGTQLQKIEGSRDNLYKVILTEQQFDLYRKKKQILITTK